MRGHTTKFPLAYVIRQDDAVAADAYEEDTDFSQVLNDSGRHDGIFWRADNAAVWLFLRSKCHKTTMWSCIEAHERRKDGRAAYLALVNELMGEDRLLALADAADQKLSRLHFDNKNRNFSWNKFTSMVRQLFLDMGARDQMSDQRKVTKIMNAWNVPNLMYIKGIILTNPELRNDPEATMTYLGTLLVSENKQQPGSRSISEVTTDQDSRQISALEAKISALKNTFNQKFNSGGSGKSKPHKKKQNNKKGKFKGLDKWDPRNPGAYYSFKCFKSLTQEQKKKNQEAKERNGGKCVSVSAVATMAVDGPDTEGTDGGPSNVGFTDLVQTSTYQKQAASAAKGILKKNQMKPPMKEPKAPLNATPQTVHIQKVVSTQRNPASNPFAPPIVQGPKAPGKK